MDYGQTSAAINRTAAEREKLSKAYGELLNFQILGVLGSLELSIIAIGEFGCPADFFFDFRIKGSHWKAAKLPLHIDVPLNTQVRLRIQSTDVAVLITSKAQVTSHTSPVQKLSRMIAETYSSCNETSSDVADVANLQPPPLVTEVKAETSLLLAELPENMEFETELPVKFFDAHDSVVWNSTMHIKAHYHSIDNLIAMKIAERLKADNEYTSLVLQLQDLNKAPSKVKRSISFKSTPGSDSASTAGAGASSGEKKKKRVPRIKSPVPPGSPTKDKKPFAATPSDNGIIAAFKCYGACVVDMLGTIYTNVDFIVGRIYSHSVTHILPHRNTILFGVSVGLIARYGSYLSV